MPSTLNSALVLLATVTVLTTAIPSRPLKVVTATNTVPLVSGLPSPTGLTLKYIGLGLGTQNYTCSGAGATAVNYGANATLYDATFLEQPAFKAEIATLPAIALSARNLNAAGLTLKVLGHHYFTAAGTPTFDLASASPAVLLSAKKVADEPAPANSAPNSVDWLFLQDNGSGVSNGLKAVYRVETAGGKATCSAAGNVYVEYAAEYWFYD